MSRLQPGCSNGVERGCVSPQCIRPLQAQNPGGFLMSIQVSDGSSYEWGLRGGESNAWFLHGSHGHPGIISGSFQSHHHSYRSGREAFNMLRLQGRSKTGRRNSLVPGCIGFEASGFGGGLSVDLVEWFCRMENGCRLKAKHSSFFFSSLFF